MSTPASCRECGNEITSDAKRCEKCGALCPANASWNGEGFEWKSRGLWMGYPLVHVAFGSDSKGRARTARGVVAVGQRAIGAVSCGIVANGIFAIGIVSFGVVSAGIVSVALAFAVGFNAIAPCATGITAIGLIVHGVAKFSWK